jgi:LAGLIDADG DNA endonuclease family
MIIIFNNMKNNIFQIFFEPFRNVLSSYNNSYSTYRANKGKPLSNDLKETIVGLSNKRKLTRKERAQFVLPDKLKNILLGLYLGDLHSQKRYPNSDVTLHFEQGQVHEAYLLHLYELFKDYCGTGPKSSTRKPDQRTNKSYSRIYFATRSLPCFNEYYSLFYVDKVKKIPNNIKDLLTSAESLAYWAMDDGVKRGSGFELSTHSYTKEGVLLLIRALESNFALICSAHMKKGNRYVIYIKADSMDKLRSLVTPYFHESMLYKLK